MSDDNTSTENSTKNESPTKKRKYFKIMGIFGVLVLIVIIVVYFKPNKKESFASPDAVVSSKKKQVRSDTHVDRTWNLEQLEKSVSLLNSKS